MSTETLKVQVVYQQGLIKTFLASGDMELGEFCKRIGSYGRVRTVRPPRSVHDLQSAMLSDPNAIHLGAPA